jgi:hypothetical protein
MTHTSTCRLSAIAGRNQNPLKDLLYTGAIFTSLFGTAAVLLSALF